MEMITNIQHKAIVLFIATSFNIIRVCTDVALVWGEVDHVNQKILHWA